MKSPVEPKETPAEMLIDIDLIDEGTNIRADIDEDTEEFGKLCRCIEIHDRVLQPIGVCKRGDRFQRLFGSRRLAALRRLGHKQAHVTILPAPADQAALEVLQLQENLNRLDLDPVRTGEVLLSIKTQRGYTNEELARQVSLNPIKVSRWIRLAELPEDIKAPVRSGQLGVTKALELGSLSEPEWRRLLPEAVSGTITRDELTSRRKSRETKSSKPKTAISRATAVLAENQTVTVAGEGLDLQSYIELLEDLLARARKARPTGISLTTFIKMLRDQATVTA